MKSQSNYEAELIRMAEAFVRRTLAYYKQQRLRGYSSAHDWWHIDRVRRLALHIASKEGADPHRVELAALLHDIDDRKFSGSDEAGPEAVRAWLSVQDVDPALRRDVVEIVRNISFKGEGLADVNLSLAGLCVRDADRLDALGAIGIGRAFIHGGGLHQTIHDPNVEPIKHQTAESYQRTDNTTINHLHEKALVIRDRMATVTGRRIADSRHAFIELFLEHFHREWDGNDI